MVYVDGNAVGDVGEDTLSDRLILGEGGFISITVAIDAHTGRRWPRRRSPAAASPPTRRRWTRWCRWSRPNSPGWRPTASPTAPGGAVGPPGRRPLGRRHLPAPADDRADRAGGLTACRRRRADQPIYHCALVADWTRRSWWGEYDIPPSAGRWPRRAFSTAAFRARSTACSPATTQTSENRCAC